MKSKFTTIARTSAKRLVLQNRFLSNVYGKKYFGLNNLDEKISKYFEYKDGYFVELGANDGITQSNTKYFELHKGWTGVLIEPSPTQYAQLKKSRSKRSKFFNCACVGFDFPKETIELM